jgi:hypothetical protein
MALHTVNKGSISRQRDLFDVNAQGTLRDPMRVEPLRPVVEPRPHGEGWSIASGLLTRDDGALLEPEPSPA